MSEKERNTAPESSPEETSREKTSCSEEVFDGLLSFFAQIDDQQKESDDPD